MAELAKTHIEIIDESMYGAGNSSTIPLYIFATAENKVLDEDTGEIAQGTTKATANEVLLLTSQSDVIDTYGTPNFTVVDGTVQQGDELNEVGLFALYSGLGSSSLAYGLRADVDLNQLIPSQVEPTNPVANGTLWFDELNTTFGLFRANGNKRSSLAWDKIENILKPSAEYLDENHAPIDTYGQTGDVAYVNHEGVIKFYENIEQKWYQIGSEEWKNHFQSSVTVPVTTAVTTNSTDIKIMNDTINLPSGKTAEDLAELINTHGFTNIVAVIKDEKLTITNNNELLTIIEVSGTGLEELGFDVDASSKKVKISSAIKLYFQPHTLVPSGLEAGSIWLKTTEPNYGASYLCKTYNTNKSAWVKEVVHMYDTYMKAEADLYPLSNKALMFKFDADASSLKLMEYVDGEFVTVTATKDEALTSGNSINIVIINNGVERSYTVTLFGTTTDDLMKNIKSAKIPNMLVDKVNGKLRLVMSNGYAFRLENKTGDILSHLGLESGAEYISDTWKPATYIASLYEPSSVCSEGTMWFNDNLDVDIMINDGEQWLGYKNKYPLADIYVTSDVSDKTLHDNDLWIDSSAATYPTIYRYIDNEWELVDNADQSTPNGIIFADARPNAGPSYEGSTHTAFSTKYEDMMKSNYVDPNCTNPQTYPAEILLFNTLYSTNNVKEFKDVYKDSVKDLGETFTVGNSKTFATPGSSSNPVTTRWANKSGNALDGSGLFGSKAQRAVIVKALVAAIVSNNDIRGDDYDFFFVNCAGYPELDDELIALNADKKEMFYIVSDTPAHLAPNAIDIQKWGSNKNNAAGNGDLGRVTKNAYMTRQYPSMGLTSNVDGNEIAVPSSIVKMKNLLVLPRGQIAAGTQYGQVLNAASVGYITDENEYAPVTVKNGLGEVLVAQSINPIMPRRNTGLLFWGEATENPYTSSLSDEHAILTILRLKRELESACLPYFFKLNTQSVRNNFDATLRSILNDYVAREELYDYTLVTDNSVNTAERIERKELWAEIAVEIVKGIEQIYLPIRIVKTGSL